MVSAVGSSSPERSSISSMGMWSACSRRQRRVSQSWRTSSSTSGSGCDRRAFNSVGVSSPFMVRSPPPRTISRRAAIVGEEDRRLRGDFDLHVVAQLEAASYEGGGDHLDLDGAAGNAHVIELARALEDVRGDRARDAARSECSLLDSERLRTEAEQRGGAHRPAMLTRSYGHPRPTL